MYKTTLWKQRRRYWIRQKRKETIWLILMVIAIALGIIGFYYGLTDALYADTIDPAEWISDGEIHKVSCTAYVDDQTATGKRPVEGVTIAGPRAWIGCTCALYTEDMEFVGFYEFSDVGYGKETDHGDSQLRKGEHLGTIESGEWIDMYFDTEAAMEAWGKRTVYIQVIKSEG